MNKLYEITHTLNAAWQLIEESADEDGSFDSRLKSVFDAVQEEFDDKIDGCCRIVSDLIGRAAACKAEADRLNARSQALKARSESLKKYMLEAMQATQQTKVETDLFTVSIRKNPPSVLVSDASQIPGQFIQEKIEYVIQKGEISKALKAGEEVPGAELVQGERLEIK